MSKPEIGRGHWLQRDLFTGEWEARPPQRGKGSHVRLKLLDGEKPIVAGMASFEGEGPAGTYCRDCAYFGEVAVERSHDAAEKSLNCCVLYAQRMGHPAPTKRRDIKLCSACKYFEPVDEAYRFFIVDASGVIHRANQASGRSLMSGSEVSTAVLQLTENAR